MITRLYLNNCFTHQDRTFTFTTGLTGVIGPNESGKSLIQEMIRYALFGSAALRATAPKDLHVELDFEVAGVFYTVVRKGRNATLGSLAVGVKPVNEAIIKILGYDLQVFDVANSCNQGSVEALTDMRPAERKAMVDRTVGLDTLDTVIKHLGERGNALKSEAMGLRAGMVEPLVPEAPEGYTTSADLRPLVAVGEDDLRELNQLQGFLSRRVEKPEGGPCRTTEVLRFLKAEARGDVAEFLELKGFLARSVKAPAEPEACTVQVQAQDLAEHQRQRALTLAQQSKLQAIEPEEYTEAELDARVSQWDQFDLWQERVRLLAQGHICCPACNHTWPVAGNVPEVSEISKPSMSRAAIAAHRARLGNDQRRVPLATLEVPEDLSAALATRERYEASLAAYARALEAYQAYNAGLPERQARFAELEGCEAVLGALDQEMALATKIATYEEYEAEAAPKRERVAELSYVQGYLPVMRARLAEAVAHEAALASYASQKQRHQSLVERLVELVGKSETYLQARIDVVDLKTRVKSHLLPSLNRVASLIINEMTGGARYLVEIDDDFDIQIDGAAVGTLSGSGKAVANLAIRIALGHILTNRVFSLFMADEVDGSMDVERAEYVAQALQRLTGRVRQVILITHKRPQVDQQIELKK